MERPRIPYGRQDISSVEIAAARAVLESEWLTTGPAVSRFESELAKWTDGTPVVAVSSGTAALHCAYVAAGVGPGDEIITTPLTFVATQATAVALGARPVFADVQIDTGNLDPASAEAAITPNTKAISVVDYAGHPADLDEFRAICDRYGLLLIEDAAHSLGSRYRGRAVGALADLTAFSFFPTKNITTAEGGAVAAPDSGRLERARTFAHQGLVRDASRFLLDEDGPWHQEVHSFGLNYRLPDVLCAIGEAQLRRLEQFKIRRAEIKARYDAAFSSIDGLTIPAQRPYVDPVWHLYPLRVPAAARRNLFVELHRRGVNVQVNYLPSYRHPAFETLPTGPLEADCPNAEDYYAREISLPMFSRLTDLEVDYVVDAVITALELASG